MMGFSLLLNELSWFRNIVPLFHLRIIPHDFVRSQQLSEIISLVFFCSIQFIKNSTFLNINLKEQQPIIPSPPDQLLVILLKINKMFWSDLNFPII